MRFALIVGLLLAFSSTAKANAVYISQAGGGAGTSCGSAQSAAYFNNGSNWSGSPTGIQIGPGTTVHICGTITTQLTFKGSGTSGNVINLLAESGARLSQPAGDLLSDGGQSNLLIDGNSVGVIENTANGVNLANQENVQAIFLAGDNIEIRGWTFQNEYVAAPPTAAPGIDDTLNCFVYSNGVGGTSISIHDNVMHDTGWSINLGGVANGTVVRLYNNNIYNMDHAGVIGDGSNSYTVYENNNHIHDQSNWDTSTNTYHHDGFHLYNGSGGPGSWGTDLYYIYDNIFDGNRGVNFTSDIFYENGSGAEPQVWVFNNVDVQTPGVYMTNGFTAVGDGLLPGSLNMFNNTYVGDPTVNNQSLARLAGTSLILKNNVLSGGNNLLSVEAGSSGGSGIDYNVYAQQGAGGNFRWNWEAIGGTNTFTTWQSNCSSCDSHSSYQGSAMISSTGQPLSGSPLLGAGTNLTSLCSGALTPLCSDINGVARPAVGAWTVGAYQGSGGGGFIATPSIFGIAVQ